MKEGIIMEEISLNEISAILGIIIVIILTVFMLNKIYSKKDVSAQKATEAVTVNPECKTKNFKPEKDVIYLFKDCD